MTVITAPTTAAPSIIPEAVINVYQGINAITRIFRKGCEGVERVNDVALLYMEDAIAAQHQALLARKQTLQIN